MGVGVRRLRDTFRGLVFYRCFQTIGGELFVLTNHSNGGVERRVLVSIKGFIVHDKSIEVLTGFDEVLIGSPSDEVLKFK